MKIYRVVLPNAFGYGLEAISAKSKDDALHLLEQEYITWLKQSEHLSAFYSFQEAMEYFSGFCFEITLPYRGAQDSYEG